MTMVLEKSQFSVLCFAYYTSFEVKKYDHYQQISEKAQTLEV